MSYTLMWGVVSKDGSIISGTDGLQCSLQATGTYLISFPDGFSEAPAVVGSQTGFGSLKENPCDNVAFPQVTPGTAIAVTGDNYGNFQNRQFSFIAVARAAD